jgi:hypothetical protein
LTATARERRIGYVSWMAVTDPVYRLPRMTGSQGRGLRGGSYTASREDGTVRLSYHRARFAVDVAVTGSASLAANRLTADIRVQVADQRAGRLTVRGVLWDPAHPRARLTGTLDGHAVDLTVPTR